MLRPHMRAAAYSNYFDDAEKASRVRDTMGDNFQRLQALKDRFDPGNLLHRNQNIPPTAHGKRNVRSGSKNWGQGRTTRRSRSRRPAPARKIRKFLVIGNVTSVWTSVRRAGGGIFRDLAIDTLNGAANRISGWNFLLKCIWHAAYTITALSALPVWAPSPLWPFLVRVLGFK